MQPRKSLRIAVRNFAQQMCADIIGTESWLNCNYTFNHGVNLLDEVSIKKAETLLDGFMEAKLRIRDKDRKRADIRILCANLLVNGRYKPVAISLNKNDYVRNRYIRASDFTRELVTLMEQDGWIESKKGYLSKKEKESRLTRIWPSEKFLNHFSQYYQLGFEPVELVNLKDENDKDVLYDDNEETIRIRNILSHANQVNKNASVCLKRRHRLQPLNTDLYAIFHNSSFEQGGRLYNGNGGYQTLISNQRKQILFSSQSTVELDFSGMQPRLLYALEGIQYPLNVDPYTSVCVDTPELRPFIKKLILALLNAETRGKAVLAGNHKIYTDEKLRLLLKEKNLKMGELIERIETIHHPISQHFGTQIGFMLMNLDSKIALEVIEHFTNMNIPILPIHDSFIVQEHREDELRKVMDEAYRKHTDGFACPIKK